MICLLVLLPGWTATVRAQPLIEHVPGDAWGYVGWAGTDALGEAYDASTLKRVVSEIDTRAVRRAWQRAAEAIEREADDPEAGKALALAGLMIDAAWRGPFALQVLAPTAPRDEPTVVMTWSLPDAQARARMTEPLRALSVRNGQRQRLIEDGDIVHWVIGPRVPHTAETTGSLADTMKAAGVDLGASRAVVAYGNVPALTAWLRAQAERDNDPAALAVMDALELDGLGPALLTGGFDQESWRTDFFLSAAAPRAGVATLLDAPPLEPADLAVVPADATWVQAGAFDLRAVLSLVREVARATGPDGEAQLDQALNMASGMLGVDVQQRFLGGFGPGWVAYLDPGGTGDGFQGLTITNRLRDPEGVAQGLRSLVTLGNMALRQQQQTDEFTWLIHETDIAGHAAYCFPAFLLTPTLAVVDERLVLTLYPQTFAGVADRIRQQADDAEPRVAHPALLAALDGVADQPLTGVGFVDLPRTAPGSYGQLVAWEQVLTSLSAMTSGQPTPMLLPPLERLRTHLTPLVARGWVDDAGWHSTALSPFPGAGLLGPSGGNSTTAAPLMAGILLPALGAARRTARQMEDNTQLRMVQIGLHAFRAEHNDASTDDIGVLVIDGYVTLDTFDSPADDVSIPPDLFAAPPKQQADWVRKNSPYILVPNAGRGFGRERIAIFLRPDIYAEPGDRRGAVGYGDGTVESRFDWDAVEAKLIEQTGMTTDELIARQAALAER